MQVKLPVLLATGTAALLVACASPLPAVTWVRLPDLPGPPPVSAAGGTAAMPHTPHTWQLMAPLPLPGHLDRDALLLPQGQSGLQPLGAVRWAEPLRDAVPRLLRQDLSQALAQPLWQAPLPPGVRPTRQLRIEILAFDVTAEGVLLHARWNLADAAGATAPRLGEARFTTPAAPTADALALAHRQALQRLAARIARQAGA